VAVRGRFRIDNVPVGKDVPLVVQVGKWRRQVMLPEVLPCQDERRRVAFSCKAGGFCPSCLGRRMAQLSANLVAHVLAPCMQRSVGSASKKNQKAIHHGVIDRHGKAHGARNLAGARL
jgi:hypothetical protein